MNNTEQSLKEIKELIAMQNAILCNITAMFFEMKKYNTESAYRTISLTNAVEEQILKYNCEDVKNITV